MTRNWSEYNEKLVKRGEFYLSVAFLDSWDDELERMNEGKVGRPYEFPETYIQFATLWYEFFHLLYRQLEEALCKLGELLPELKVSDYTSLWHRFKDLDLEIPDSDGVIVVVDATGFKVTNRGEWLRKYHNGKRRGWIKVHIAVDVKNRRLLSIEVMDEKTGDSEIFEELSSIWILRTVLRMGPMIWRRCSKS